MKPKLLLTIAIVVLVGVFALANWGTFSTPTSINLLVGQVEAPLGIIMLMTLVVVMLVYLILLAVAEGSSIMAQRRMSREMERLRRLADQSEESRFAALRSFVETEFAALHDKLDRIAARQDGAPSGEPAVGSLLSPNRRTS